jgi:hypothetical protein
MLKYNNQDHAMMTGLPTALNIAAGETLYGPSEVNEEAEYSEGGVGAATLRQGFGWQATRGFPLRRSL